MLLVSLGSTLQAHEAESVADPGRGSKKGGSRRRDVGDTLRAAAATTVCRGLEDSSRETFVVYFQFHPNLRFNILNIFWSKLLGPQHRASHRKVNARKATVTDDPPVSEKFGSHREPADRREASNLLLSSSRIGRNI